MLDDLGLDDGGIGFSRGVAAEIDFDHTAACGVRGRQRFQRGSNPMTGRFGEVEIAIDTFDHALGAELGEPLVEPLAGSAEFRIGGIAKRQDSVFDSVEARRAVLHQFGIHARRPSGRFALAPGGRDDDEPRGGRQRRQIELGHIDQYRLEAELARLPRHIAGELLGISGFAGEDDGEGFRSSSGRRPRRPRRLLDAGEEARQPRPLHRGRRADHAVEQFDVLFRERRAIGDGGDRTRHAGLQNAMTMPVDRSLFYESAITDGK